MEEIRFFEDKIVYFFIGLRATFVFSSKCTIITPRPRSNWSAMENLLPVFRIKFTIFRAVSEKRRVLYSNPKSNTD